MTDTTQQTWHQRNAAGFHRFISTDETEDVLVPFASGRTVSFPVDRCMQCGVRVPDTGEGAESDHETLPLLCPGPDVQHPHRFGLGWGWSSNFIGYDGRVHSTGGYTLVCHDCGYAIRETTVPSSVDWECRP